MTELVGHSSVVNGISWAPHSSNHLVTIGDDRQVLIWDIAANAKPFSVLEDPILAFHADGDLNQVQWCKSHEDWVGICFNDMVSILKV